MNIIHLSKLNEYNVKYWNPIKWLLQAERNKYSSTIIFRELENLINRFNSLTPYEEEDFISLCYSYFLLVGLSFENLVKGLIISKCTDYNEEQKKTNIKLYNWNNKHYICKMIECNYRKLNFQEKSTILKIEKYLRWLSKYHIPINPAEDEINNLISSKDKQIIETIYEEMNNMLQVNWGKNEIHFEKWCEEIDNQ